MGIRDELQTEVAAAFDTDLQDAVNEFAGSYTVRGAWDPVTETGTETQVTYSGRGVLARYKLRRIDGVNFLHGDVKPPTHYRLLTNSRGKFSNIRTVVRSVSSSMMPTVPKLLKLVVS